MKTRKELTIENDKLHAENILLKLEVEELSKLIRQQKIAAESLETKK